MHYSGEAENVSTVRDSEKSPIMTNIKSTMGFPTTYRCVRYPFKVQ